MIVDSKATMTAPDGWTIWRTSNRWQPVHSDCRSEGDGLHGSYHLDPDSAIAEAIQLSHESPAATH